MASSDLVNMGISVVSYTLKDVHDDQVKQLALKDRISSRLGCVIFYTKLLYVYFS